MSSTAPTPSVAVVVTTRDRCLDLLGTLPRLVALVRSGEVAEVVVVDNGSSDGTAQAVREASPDTVTLLPQLVDHGAHGRTIGARHASADLVAFADDDSWWERGSLACAAHHFARTPSLGLLHSCVVEQPAGILDPVCHLLSWGERRPGLPGPSVLGHLATGVVVRRDAFLAVGGYGCLMGSGGVEERLPALDLADAGWDQCYVPDVVSLRHRSPSGDVQPERWARHRRNDAMTSLLRLPAGRAARETATFLRQAALHPAVRHELGPLVRRLPAIVRERRRVSPEVLGRLEEARGAPFV